jgi:hypothetical protein
MALSRCAAWMLEQEARALLTRLGRVKPLAMQESMLPAAGLLPESETAIERFLSTGRQHLKSLVLQFLAWLRSPAAARCRAESPPDAKMTSAAPAWRSRHTNAVSELRGEAQMARARVCPSRRIP